MKHVTRNIVVLTILTAEDINDTIRVIVDYRVGIYAFNKCDRCY